MNEGIADAEYRRVADVLRARIASGELAPGDRLPSYTEIEKRFDVTPGIARSAIRAIREEGLARTIPGKGTYVLPPKPTEPSGEFQDVMRRLDALEAAMRKLADEVAEVRGQAGVTSTPPPGLPTGQTRRAGHRAAP